MNLLKPTIIDFINHLHKEEILSLNCIDINQGSVELIHSIKEELQALYLDTALRIPVKSIHYANNFDDGGLKTIAFQLDEISQLLYFNNLLKQEEVVEFFNSEITKQSFDFSPVNLVITTIKGLCTAKK